jgi:hypothetical protein
MSGKTLQRLVLGQLVLLVVIAAVLVWVIIPDEIGAEQSNPVQVSPSTGSSQSDNYGDQQQTDSSGAVRIDFDAMDLEAKYRLLGQVAQGLGRDFGVDLGPYVAKAMSNQLAQDPSREFTAEEQDWFEQYLAEQAKLPWLDVDDPGSWAEMDPEKEIIIRVLGSASTRNSCWEEYWGDDGENAVLR